MWPEDGGFALSADKARSRRKSAVPQGRDRLAAGPLPLAAQPGPRVGERQGARGVRSARGPGDDAAGRPGSPQKSSSSSPASSQPQEPSPGPPMVRGPYRNGRFMGSKISRTPRAHRARRGRFPTRAPRWTRPPCSPPARRHGRARAWMSRERKAFEAEINVKLNAQLEALEPLRKKQFEQLDIALRIQQQPGISFAARKEEERGAIDAVFDEFIELGPGHHDHRGQPLPPGGGRAPGSRLMAIDLTGITNKNG